VLDLSSAERQRAGFSQLPRYLEYVIRQLARHRPLQTDVLFLHAVVGFGFGFISPPSLSARQPNHQPLFQLFKGHSQNQFRISTRFHWPQS
jgi:hypothetical protein